MVNNDHCVDAQKPVVFALSLVGACIRVWLAHVSEFGWRMYETQACGDELCALFSLDQGNTQNRTVYSQLDEFNPT